MENTKYGRRMEGRWTPIRAKAQDTRANPNSWETYIVRKRWDIGLLRALSPRTMMMMMMMMMTMMMMRRRMMMRRVVGGVVVVGVVVVGVGVVVVVVVMMMMM